MLRSARKQHGFNMVELMIALVVGLVVSFAVVAFMASMLQTNAATIQSTRLNQELRSISEVISREVRRARAMRDPISNMGMGVDDPATVGVIEGAQNAWEPITVEPDCVLFGYENATGDDYRAVRRAVVGGLGAVVLAQDESPVDCDASGTTINSGLVDVTALEFEIVGGSRIDLRLVGRLVGNDDIAPKEFRTSIFIRSGSI